MASIQCQRPVDHNHHQKPVGPTKNNPQNAPTQNKCNHTCSCCQTKENEHSFTNKVKVMAYSAKGMANSAYKKVADQMHHHDQPTNAAPKPAAGGKKNEGAMSNCIPKIGDLKKKEKHSKKKENNCNCKKDGNSSSSSSSDSDNDNDNDNAHVKKHL